MTALLRIILVLHLLYVPSCFTFFFGKIISDTVGVFLPGFKPPPRPNHFRPLPPVYYPPLKPVYYPPLPPLPPLKPPPPPPPPQWKPKPIMVPTTITPITTTDSDLVPLIAEPEKIHRLCYCGLRPDDQPVGKKLSQVPWRCILSTKKKKGDFKVCGGSLISNQYILTSAHCASDKPADGSGVIVTCGDPKPDGPKFEVDKIITHPEYNADTQDHDIALIHLTRPLPPEYKNDTVCLPWSKQGSDCDNPGSTVRATGSGEGPRDPLKIKVVPCFATEKCAEFLGDKYDLNTNMFCTHEKGKDTCMGDPGGSIDFLGGIGMYYVLGISTPGEGCQSNGPPAVYTKVTAYLDWIKEVGGDNKSFCNPEIQSIF